MRSCFDWAFEEVMFSAAIWSSNQDPLRPKVVTITRLAHPLGAADPGSRWGIDNPDSVYRVIPISGSEEYRIHGRVAERRLTENYFTLWDPKMNTIDVLSGHDLVLTTIARSRSLSTRSPRTAGPTMSSLHPMRASSTSATSCSTGRTTSPTSSTIERLGDPPSTPPLTIDEQAELTAEYMLKFADFSADLEQERAERPGQRIRAGLVGRHRRRASQPGVPTRPLQPRDDEAFVINVSDGGAAYFVVPISNIWGTTLDLVTAPAR